MITFIIIAAAYIFIGLVVYCLEFRHQIKISMFNFRIDKKSAVDRFEGQDYAWFMFCELVWPLMLIIFLFIWIHRHILEPIVMKSIKERKIIND